MSGSKVINDPTTTPASVAVSVAKGGSELVSLVQQVDPPLYAQLVGSAATYCKSATAPVVGAALGLLVVKLGIGPYVTPDLMNLLTGAVVGIGTALGAAIMHYLSKAPGRALQAAPPPVITPSADTVARITQ